VFQYLGASFSQCVSFIQAEQAFFIIRGHMGIMALNKVSFLILKIIKFHMWKSRYWVIWYQVVI
jgi:hypothetical protein